MKHAKPFDPAEFMTLKEALAVAGGQAERIVELERAMCDCRHRLGMLSMGTEGQVRKMIGEAAGVLTLALTAQRSPSEEGEK